MKKLISIVISITIALSLLTACNGQGASTDSSRVSKDSDEYDLTIVSCGGTNYTGDLSMILLEFEKEYGWKINIIDYDIEKDYYALQTKLLAKDPDIDLIWSQTLDIFTLIHTEYYEDLGKYDSLRTRLDSNAFTKYACSYNGKYFGISVYPTFDAKDVGYDVAFTIRRYMMRNINLVERTYDDPDGEEFFEVLKHYYKYPDDPKDCRFYEGEYPEIMSQYMILSPYSNDKENAVKFLERVFDYINGDIQYEDSIGKVLTANTPYPDVSKEELEGVYLIWQHIDADDTTKPLGDALTEALKSDGSDETLRKLAQEAAREVRRRLEG